MNTVLVVFLALLGIIMKATLKVYEQTPLAELRHQKHQGNPEVKRLIVAVQQLVIVRIILSFLMVICGLAVVLVLENFVGWTWAGIVGSFYFIFIIVVPKGRKSWKLSRKVATKLAPILASCAKTTKPVISIFLPLDFAEERFPQIYDKDQLVELLRAQKRLKGSRLPPGAIDSLIKELNFKQTNIKHIMTTQKEMNILQTDDLVGPILLSELHDSKQSAFVVKDEENNIVGVVHLNNLKELREGGKVERALDRELTYVDQEAVAEDVLKLFLSSKKEVFLVKDHEGKVCGITTLQSAIKELL